MSGNGWAMSQKANRSHGLLRSSGAAPTVSRQMASHENDEKEVAGHQADEPAWRIAFRRAQEEADRELLRIHREAQEQGTTREVT